MVARRIIILCFVFLYLYFPVYCLAALVRAGNVGKYFWVLPDLRDFKTITNGVFTIWPFIVLLLWATARLRAVKQVFSLIITRANFSTGWKIGLFLFAFHFLLLFLRVRFRGFWALVFMVPALGFFTGYLQHRLDGSRTNVLKLGWGVFWRITVFNFALYTFGAVITLAMMYVSLGPALAFVEVVGEKKTAFVQILKELRMLGPAYTPVVKFFANCDMVMLLFLYAGLVLISALFIPGLAFWRAVRKSDGSRA